MSTPTRADFERLAIEQMDMLYRVARRLTRDSGRAEDLVQEAYLRAFKAQNTFRLQAFGIRPWLLRILYNLHLSKAQYEGRQPVPIDGEHLELASADRHGRDLPVDPRSFESMDQNLVRAVESLASEYQAVLLLWAVEDFSYREIAEALDIPIGTVMSRLHRARHRLAELLRDYAVEERLIRE
jgi:RNA polymerase sigma-70 factor, ECF subfamily